MRKFKDDLVEAMKCYLEPHFDNENELFVEIGRASCRERV